jgi:hypothetical protein
MVFGFALSVALISGHKSALACNGPSLQHNMEWCCNAANHAKDRDRILTNLSKWIKAGKPNEGTTAASNFLYEIRDGYKTCQDHGDHSAQSLADECTSQEISEIASHTAYCH